MDKSKQMNINNLSNIPEVIDPGITIPIYEEEYENNGESNSQLQQQPQKLGSYRSRAGKFSNTLSNLLPSISAKLHHSKKNSHGKNGAEFSSSNNSSQSTVASKTPRASPSRSKMMESSIDGVTMDRPGSLTPPQDMEKLVHFPDSSNNFLIPAPRGSSDSFNLPHQISRTRNNTMSSQITSISSIAPKPRTSSGIWSSNASANDPMQQHLLQQLQPTTSNNTTNSNTLNDYSTKTAYFDNMVSTSGSQMADNKMNTNNLAIPNSVWSNTRQRSQSNASSIYTDAPLYEQPARASISSHYTIPTQESPLIADEIDPQSINWVTMDPTVPSINQISNLLPTNTISISNVFPLQHQQPQLNNAINLTSTSLATLCSKYGEVISARTLRNLNMALVEFSSVESAVKALDSLQGKEVSMIGAPSKISFAKILPMHQQPPQFLLSSQGLPLGLENNNLQPQPLLQEQLFNGAVTFQQQGNVSIPVFNQQSQQSQHQNHSSGSAGFNNVLHGYNNNNSMHGNNNNSANEKEQCPFPLPPPNVNEKEDLLREIIELFEANSDEYQINSLIKKSLNHKGTSDTQNFGPLPEPLSGREFDPPKLRELRKSIDSNAFSDLEIEQLAIAMLDELPELSSDYLGNTIVQKLFEHSSDIIKDIMLRKTSKYLTSMGVHKNGTWACQKMITMAHTPRQIMQVTQGVKDYCTPLINDQFGNYVIQCVLKFGFPWNQFIFESIIANFWVIVQNRYGARAVRACLEAHDIVTPEQSIVLSAMIVTYAEYLSTNSNGALLVTWFLDTSVLPNRHSILAPRLTKRIVELCGHRLASLTILKVLNYRGDDNARKIILDSLFGNVNAHDSSPPKELTKLLCETNYGPTFVHKVLAMPLLEDDLRAHIIKQVRKALTDSTQMQPSRRLLEEVGLASPSSTHNKTKQQQQQHHNSSISHMFATPDTSGQHMRGLSVSSVKSGGSKHTTMNTTTTNGSSASTLSPGQPLNANSNSSMGYFSYPGVFPVSGFSGNASNGYAMNNDDLSSQFDMLNFNNGTRLSLPQLSLTNHNNTTMELVNNVGSSQPHTNNNNNNNNTNYNDDNTVFETLTLHSAN
ncbi:CPS_HP_G0099460.mRNA.1.CDS.1 [Saccharomyces cerevisiae]|nr:CPS_HP_G0031160.mRNA.1.CDS.1 [Saccharomyces cerevisiae]CAI4983586.1 CPS_HP_G0062150.mRNA.1.CDS.1 [Saccharomyces cerevisiae]CAI5027917.1 CPS_HP_G0099460.mRNA.1.CDS.1 [Saccharomyces cerevisiae]CAI6536038.1 CPS_HP_G0031160.mRNA.1.CDS.1 [Saccharomyces cerevisiae]CAI6831337.1 CPS_HP_G0062150.mRNA.1.CDS.1 [Saccharomyces cerevisiae]